MQEHTDVDDLLTKPLSEDELAQYQEVLGSEAFQDMVRAYHSEAALSAIRQVVLAWFKQGVSLEAMDMALANIWIDCLARAEPRLDQETQQSWRHMPQMIGQILLQQAMDVLQENQAELNSSYTLETSEMHQEWARHLPAPRIGPIDDEAIEAREIEHTLGLYYELSQLREKIEASGLKLDAADYLEIWTLIVLQTYIFGRLEQPDLFYVLDTNWDLFLPRLSDIVTLMFLLKGAENLLLPENRMQLNDLLQTDAFHERLKQYTDQP